MSRPALLGIGVACMALGGAAATAGAAEYTTGHVEMAGDPVVGGSVKAETLSGDPLPLEWGPLPPEATDANGTFMLPEAGLPERFVVSIEGGTLRGAPTGGALRAVAAVRPGELDPLAVSLASSVAVSAQREMAGDGADADVAGAEALTRRYLGVPASVDLASEVDHLFASKRVRSLANRLGGAAPLAEAIARRALDGKRPDARLVRETGGATFLDPPAGADRRGGTIKDCTKPLFTGGFTASSAFDCAHGTLMWIIGKFRGGGPSQLDVIQKELEAMREDLGALRTESQQGINELKALQYKAIYQQRAGALDDGLALELRNSMNTLIHLGTTVPENDQQAALLVEERDKLFEKLDPSRPDSPINPDRLAAMQKTILLRSGSQIDPALDTAWQWVRANQLLPKGTPADGESGGQANVKVAVARSTNLLTPEATGAYLAIARYWASIMAIAQDLSINYYNAKHGFEPGGSDASGSLTEQALTKTREVVNGTAPGGDGSKCWRNDGAEPVGFAPYHCDDSVSGYLSWQLDYMPQQVPERTVIDTSTGLIWGAFEERYDRRKCKDEREPSPFNAPHDGSCPEMGWPTGSPDSQSYQESLPDYVDRLNEKGGGPEGSDLVTSGWRIPSMSFKFKIGDEQKQNNNNWWDAENAYYDGNADQFGRSDRSGKRPGLLGQIAVPNDAIVPSSELLGDLTDPPVFPKLDGKDLFRDPCQGYGYDNTYSSIWSWNTCTSSNPDGVQLWVNGTGLPKFKSVKYQQNIKTRRPVAQSGAVPATVRFFDLSWSESKNIDPKVSPKGWVAQASRWQNGETAFRHEFVYSGGKSQGTTKPFRKCSVNGGFSGFAPAPPFPNEAPSCTGSVVLNAPVDAEHFQWTGAPKQTWERKARWWRGPFTTTGNQANTAFTRKVSVPL